MERKIVKGFLPIVLATLAVFLIAIVGTVYYHSQIKEGAAEETGR